MSEFKIGQKVIVPPDARSYYGGGRGTFFPSGFGWIVADIDSDGDYRVSREETGSSDDDNITCFIQGKFLIVAEPDFPRPITFEEVEVGDTVRLTHDFGKGDSIVRTMTVDSIDGHWLESANEDMLIARGISISSNATLELLARPEPKKVYGVGDEIVGAEIKNLPHQTVVRSLMQGTVRVFDKYGNSDTPGLVGASNRLYMENINDTGKFVIVYLPEEGVN